MRKFYLVFIVVITECHACFYQPLLRTKNNGLTSILRDIEDNFKTCVTFFIDDNVTTFWLHNAIVNIVLTEANTKILFSLTGFLSPRCSLCPCFRCFSSEPIPISTCSCPPHHRAPIALLLLQLRTGSLRPDRLHTTSTGKSMIHPVATTMVKTRTEMVTGPPAPTMSPFLMVVSRK